MGAHDPESGTAPGARIEAARTPQSLTSPAAAPRRAARAVDGHEVAPDELHVLAAANRLPARLGLPLVVGSASVWRAYAAARAVWRLRRRLGR